MKGFINLILVLIAIIIISCSEDKQVHFPIGENCNNLQGTQDDPLYPYQWHLENVGQSGGSVDEDLDASAVWNRNITGCGVVAIIIDDGLDHTHEDLKDNVITDMNYNYLNSKKRDISGISYNDCERGSGCHGTSVAGIIAARGMNGIGIRGIAPDANLAGFNLLYRFTSSNQLDAMVRHKSYEVVSNNSWGPNDKTGQLQPSDELWVEGILNGITNGRNGKGVIYVWAAGNGARFAQGNLNRIDNSNYDGYANHYGVIAVAGIDHNGKQAFYSENGANIWISAYSGDALSSGANMITTDISGDILGDFPEFDPLDSGNGNSYSSEFSGTSAAAPVVTGVIALMLQANPNLTWRDVKIILAQSAHQNDFADSDWIYNGAGYHVNHKYGFGVINADDAVVTAIGWQNVGPMVEYSSSTSNPGLSIPDNNTTGVTDSITVKGSNINKIETIAISVTITHSYSGDLKIILLSPNGTESILSEPHTCYDEETFDEAVCSFFSDGNTFTFSSVRTFGEQADGQWQLKVVDGRSSDSGSFNSWSITFYGRND